MALTDQHEALAGTNISLIPPPDYSVSTNFKGFQNPQDPYSMIMVVEIPAPFRETTKGFNDEMMSAQKMTLTGKKCVFLESTEGLLLDIEQEASGLTFSKTILVYGDDDLTTMVNGVWLKEDSITGQAIRQSVLTTHVNFDLVVDARKMLSFILSEEGTNLQFHSVIGNGMLFNRDGKIPSESPDQLNVIVDKAFAKVETVDKEQFCINRLAQMPGKFSFDQAKGMRDITIDGISGYELFAIGGETNDEELYQAILFLEEGGYYIIVATYDSEAPSALEDVRRLLASFERK